jgi:lactoylglutathione lyase
VPLPRALGINHVALVVGDLDGALEWYGRFLDFDLRDRHPSQVEVDLGDQFIALAKGGPHFGLVVDDKEATREALLAAGVDLEPGRRLRFVDPWGNTVEVVDYREIQFTKAPEVLKVLAPEGLEKTEAAREELREKGIEA